MAYLKLKHSPQSGRTMIEIIAVLVIIGILGAGGLIGYSKAMRRHRLNETISEISVMVTNVRAFYGNTDNYEDFNAQTAVKYNIATQRMIGVGSTLVNQYKGRVTISLDRANRNGPENTAFVLTYRDLPVEACVGLARTDWGYAEKYGFISISIGGDDQDPSYPAKPSQYFVENKQIAPLEMDESITHCSGSSPEGARSTVSLKFY
jgi:prepilin-type N-terminal cleavage/methylation domain-containing protein